MSTQKSATQTTPRKASLGSNGPRVISKSRTASDVSQSHSPPSLQDPYDPKQRANRHSFSSKLLTKVVVQHDPIQDSKGGWRKPARRFSHDAQGKARSYLIQVDETRRALLQNEDSDGNKQITIEDRGPKTIALGTAPSAGYKKFDVRGTYMLSNLLQELTLAQRAGKATIVLEEARLNENPVNRLSRVIKDTFWPNLTRRIDGSNIFKVAEDPKDRSGNHRPRIYVPKGASEQYEYYKRIASEHPGKQLEVIMLPDDPSDPGYVRDLNKAPGLLAIEMEPYGKTPDGKPDFRGLPFVVPGGRFNELYGWDSYMETLGLLVNDRVDLCESMVKHFCFCIKHYGKILNANRTYYLCRSQPPFLTDMALRVYDRIKHREGSLEFLRTAMLAAIKDYYGTWMSEPRLDKGTGLSRYHPSGLGVPPETEATHFEHLLKPFAKKYNMEYEEFIEAYNYRKVSEPELDEYFRHDRSVRESGHDTTNRLDGKGARLATVDLNSLLYKIEVDVARVIRNFFGDKLTIPEEWRAKGQPAVETSSMWDRRAKKRRKAMNELMWNSEKGMFFDYDTEEHQQTDFESATTFWAMWAGAATPAQAEIMVEKALPRFEVHGGLASSTEASRDAEGPISLKRPNRQWDYPFGWAPQQILAWTGLLRYGFEEDAQRLAYRWIYMMTRAFVDFNGVVVEKYNVTEQVKPHKVTAEYGNQGADFEGAPTEGFGWVNASYVYGLQIVNSHMKRALGAVASWDTFQEMTQARNPAEEQQILMDARKKEAKADGKAKQEADEAEKAEVATDADIGASSLSEENKKGDDAVHDSEERTERAAEESVDH